MLVFWAAVEECASPPTLCPGADADLTKRACCLCTGLEYLPKEYDFCYAGLL